MWLKYHIDRWVSTLLNKFVLAKHQIEFVEEFIKEKINVLEC
jgi:hypothetical protein